MIPSSTELMNMAMQAARDAAPVALAGFRQPITIDTKHDFHDMVTEFDKASEVKIRQSLLDALPSSCIVGEEGGTQGEGDVVWYVDPIDGTSNFARGLPFWCISIGVAVKGQPKAGAIYAPVSGSMFHADETGAWLNGTPLVSKGASTASRATLLAHYPQPHDLAHEPENVLREYGEMVRSFAAVRNLGSGALSLAYVAAGWVDGAICFATNAWDVSAGSFILKQSGGRYRTYYGGHECAEEGDFLRNHFYAHVQGANFPRIEAIMQRHSRLMDQA